MSAIEDMLAHNKQYAAGFNKGSLPMPPGKKLAIVTCMDARIDTHSAFGLEEGMAHVIRNAGGRIPEAIRSIVISQELLGTEELAVIHHVDCGMLTFTDDSLRKQLSAKGLEADHIAFAPFADLEESVRIDLRHYDQSPLLRHDIPVRGFVFDVTSGRLTEIHR
ncbi:MAG TPA: carbonic anhydrase [Tepidiformaceae bacterium]|nr:carbonic anhydrase [Tepidiformaceae bacterium]